MKYTVKGLATLRVALGVVDYLEDGEVFHRVIEDAITRLPPIRFTVEPASFSLSTLSVGVAGQFPSNYTVALDPKTRRVLDELLKRIHDEYRRWQFNSTMESSSLYFDKEIEAVALVYKNLMTGGGCGVVVGSIVRDRFTKYIAETLYNQFVEPIELFMARHHGTITGMECCVEPTSEGLINLTLTIEVLDDV